MAVLIEGISVVIRCSVLAERFPGSWPAFRDAVPNGTLCCDNELARVGFMTPDDTKRYVDQLAEHGILYMVDGKARDLVVADQQRGLAAPCDWAEYGRINWEGDPKKEVAACRAIGSECRQLYTPDGWTYERSLSCHFQFIETGRISECMQFLRHENGLDVYRDLETGKEVYAGRANPPH